MESTVICKVTVANFPICAFFKTGTFSEGEDSGRGSRPLKPSTF